MSEISNLVKERKKKRKKKSFKSYLLTFLVGFIILSIYITYKEYSSSDNETITKNEIENESGIREGIKGKWSTSYFELGTKWYYRFEITDSKLTYWTRFGEWEWKQEADAAHTYELSDVLRDVYGAKFRSLYTETDLGLRSGGGVTYENGCLKFNQSCLDKGW